MTHITYETAMRLKEFLGEAAVEPMAQEYWRYRASVVDVVVEKVMFPNEDTWPAYQLHDLLSKPFFEAMESKLGIEFNGELSMLGCKYFDGGLPAVERALMEMMKGESK